MFLDTLLEDDFRCLKNYVENHFKVLWNLYIRDEKLDHTYNFLLKNINFFPQEIISFQYTITESNVRKIRETNLESYMPSKMPLHQTTLAVDQQKYRLKKKSKLLPLHAEYNPVSMYRKNINIYQDILHHTS